MVSTKDLPAEITVEAVSINAADNAINGKDSSAMTASTSSTGPATGPATMAVFSEPDHASGVVIDTTPFRLSGQNGSTPVAQSNSATAASTAMRADNAGFMAQRDRAIEQQVISALRNGRDEIRFSLYPATLGQVTINLALDGQKVRIGMKTSNREASTLLLGERQSLVASLGQEGFTLDGFDVTDDAPRDSNSKDQSQNHPSKATSKAFDDSFSLDITI
jgi:flagellar hook-length control protein FliK